MDQIKSNMAGGKDEGAQRGPNVQAEELMIFKKLYKRDPVTKCKAFQMLDDYFKAAKDGDSPHELANMITFFLYHYQRIMIYELDKQVREAAQSTFSTFLGIGLSKVAPHIKNLFPIWFCTLFDTSQEVAKLSRACFEQHFAQKKSLLFKNFYKYFLHFADERLKQSEQSLSDDNSELK